MSYLLIPSFLVSDVSDHSVRSPKMNDHEQFAQVTHQKWANRRIARFFEQIAYLLIFSQKTSDSLRKLLSKFPALPGMQTNLPPFFVLFESSVHQIVANFFFFFFVAFPLGVLYPDHSQLAFDCVVIACSL